MSLFTTEEANTRTSVQDSALAHHRGQTDTPYTLTGSAAQLKETVSMLTPDTLTHYVTYGKWSLHQLIDYLIHQTGPADLYITTWSMTEDPVRSLLMLKKKGLLKRAECLLSERISERTPEVMQLARNVFDNLRFYKSHAKAFVLIGEKMSVVNVGSANLTRNKKNEIGIIDTNAGSVDFHLKWMLNEFGKSDRGRP